MNLLVDDYKCEALLKRLVGRCKGGKVNGFEWLVEVVVDFGLHINEDLVLRELRAGQKEVG